MEDKDRAEANTTRTNLSGVAECLSCGAVFSAGSAIQYQIIVCPLCGSLVTYTGR